LRSSRPRFPPHSSQQIRETEGISLRSTSLYSVGRSTTPSISHSENSAGGLTFRLPLIDRQGKLRREASFTKSQEPTFVCPGESHQRTGNSSIARRRRPPQRSSRLPARKNPCERITSPFYEVGISRSDCAFATGYPWLFESKPEQRLDRGHSDRSLVPGGSRQGGASGNVKERVLDLRASNHNEEIVSQAVSFADSNVHTSPQHLTNESSTPPIVRPLGRMNRQKVVYAAMRRSRNKFRMLRQRVS